MTESSTYTGSTIAKHSELLPALPPYLLPVPPLPSTETYSHDVPYLEAPKDSCYEVLDTARNSIKDAPTNAYPHPHIPSFNLLSECEETKYNFSYSDNGSSGYDTAVVSNTVNDYPQKTNGYSFPVVDNFCSLNYYEPYYDSSSPERGSDTLPYSNGSLQKNNTMFNYATPDSLSPCSHTSHTNSLCCPQFLKASEAPGPWGSVLNTNFKPHFAESSLTYSSFGAMKKYPSVTHSYKFDSSNAYNTPCRYNDKNGRAVPACCSKIKKESHTLKSKKENFHSGRPSKNEIVHSNKPLREVISMRSITSEERNVPSPRKCSPKRDHHDQALETDQQLSKPVKQSEFPVNFDDVIEEVLSLEEGLDNNNVKKCEAAQPILPQSQGDDGSDQIRDLLGLNGYMNNKNSESCPPDVPKVKTEPQSNNDPHVVAFIKDRQKKDNHNMIERRRRFNINDRIKDLSHLLPKNNEPYHEIVRDLRYNKGQILRASVDYIQRLKSDLETSKVADEKRRALEQQNRQLMLRVQELENQLRKHGIAVEETSVDSNLLVPSITHSDVMSPTSTASPATPYTPSATSSPLQPQPAYIPPTTVCNATELPDLNFNCGDSSDIASADTTNHLLNDLVGLIESSDPKKELLDDFTSGSFGLNLMDDDSLAFSGDPMFSSPQVSSPNSSHHSFDDALTPESMDIVS